MAEDKFSKSNDEIAPKIIRGIISDFGLVPGPFTDETRDLWILCQKLAEHVADASFWWHPAFGQIDATQPTDPRRGQWIKECAIDHFPRDVWVEN